MLSIHRLMTAPLWSTCLAITLAPGLVHLSAQSNAYTAETFEILFPVDLATVSKIQADSLSAVLQNVKYIITAVELIGHTDATGSADYNLDLSRRRAMAVHDLIVKGGVDSSQISTEWRGERDPIRTNLTLSGRQSNRRVSIVFHLVRTKKPVTITGVVTDSAESPIQAMVIFHGRHFRDSLYADSAGTFAIHVPDSTILGVDVQASGYIYHSSMMNTAREQNLAIKLRPVRAGVRFELHQFFFVGGKAVLLPASVPELQRLLHFMELNPTIKINIEGHINEPNSPRVATDSWEYDLSRRRAQLVYDYLIDQGIHPDKLSHEAFGNWEMIYPHARTAAEQARNRRVEIRIIGH